MLKRTMRSVMAMLLVFAMLASFGGTSIAFAVDALAEKEINYVSLGASNVNGFGMDGYLPDAVYEDPDLREEYNIFGYKRCPEGSYPDLLVKYFEGKGYTVNIDQHAISSMRAEEVRMMLDDSYEGDAYTEWRFAYDDNGDGVNDDGWFYGAGKLAYAELNGIDVDYNFNDKRLAHVSFDEALASLRQVYRQDIANADIITWDVGVNNFGVYLSGRVVNGSYDEQIEDIAPEIAVFYDMAKGYLISTLEEEYGDVISTVMNSMNGEHIIDSLAYSLVAYCVNYDVSMEAIYELNPDVTVVNVSIQNLMKDLVAVVDGADTELPLGDIVGVVINAANTYMAIGSPFADRGYFANVSEDDHVTFFIDQLIKYNGDPTTLDEDMINCWRVYNGGNMLAALEPFVFDEDGYVIDQMGGLQLIAIDAMAKYLQSAAKLNVIDFGSLTGDWGKVSDTGMAVIAAEVTNECNRYGMHLYSGGSYDTFERVQVSDHIWEEIALANGIDVGLMNTFAAYGVRTYIGNAFYAHPNRVGHVEIRDAIVAALEDKITGKDVVIGNINDGEAIVSKCSNYVAIGDDVVLARNSYADKFASKMGFMGDAFKKIAKAGLDIEDTMAVIEENAETIAAADLITIGYNSHTFTSKAFEQINNIMMGRPVAEYDWALYIGEENVPYVEEMLADVRESLIEQGLDMSLNGRNVTDMLMAAIETYAYSFVAYAFSYPELISAIHTLSPDAIVVVVGLYNTLDNLILTIEDNEFAIGEYVQYIVDAGNATSLAYVIMSENTVYVDVADVETIKESHGAAATTDMISFVWEMLFGGSANYLPSEAGYEYINDQLFRTLEVVEHRYTSEITVTSCKNDYYTTYTCVACGDSYIEGDATVTGHTFGDWIVISEPTCTEKGTETRTCACGASENREVSALGHDTVSHAAQAATCTEIGWDAYETCSRCDYTTYAEIEALGHDFADEWTVDKAATATERGTKSRHCSRCDETTDEIEYVDSSLMFVDVQPGKWYTPAVDYAVLNGLMNGIDATHFDPNGAMTRSMVVTVLYRLEGSPTVNGTTPFTDLKANWYKNAVAWAYENEIVKGTSATTFAPDGNVTREQIATILYRYAEFKGYNVSATAELNSFPDANKTGNWAKTALEWAYAEELITGASKNGQTVLDPKGEASRAQVATILMRFCNVFEK